MNIEKPNQEKNKNKENIHIKLSHREKEKIKEITRGISDVVDSEVIEMALEDVISTLENGHKLNKIITKDGEITGYIACEDFKEMDGIQD